MKNIFSLKNIQFSFFGTQWNWLDLCRCRPNMLMKLLRHRGLKSSKNVWKVKISTNKKNQMEQQAFEMKKSSLNTNWELVLYMPICSLHSMFFHSRNLPPASPLFKQFSALGSKGDILIELNLFNAVKSYFYLDSFISNVAK